jgi:alpha-beta hydrolase superfamily lysophospholipase
MGRDRAAEDYAAADYEAVPLADSQDGERGQDGAPDGRALLRRRSAWLDRARPSGRGVIYVLCRGDDFVADDVVSWYTDRGFRFYAADLREVGRQGSSPRDSKAAAEDLDACFGYLDAAVAHLRHADAVDTTVMCAHSAGALIAALWCHARRGRRPADALILGRPHLARGHLAGRPAWRGSPMIASAQRRLRQGLDISCPVLVMCPPADRETAGGLLASRVLGRGRATIRLGEHVTWLDLAAGPPGQPQPSPAERRRYFDELSRWLGAYLSGQIRDQLL